MTEPTTISVRGVAHQVVPPDFAVLHLSIQSQERGKHQVLERAASSQGAVLDALRARGGVSLTVDTVDAALTWSTRSFSAHEEFDHDGRRKVQVGWRVHVPIRVTVRDLDRLAELTRAVLEIPDVVVENVRWEVDPRNPAWPLVRAAAIQDAIAKARDYATALGGEVTALVHVADEGLMGGQDGSHRHQQREYAMSAGDLEFESSGAPSVDPVPQEVRAVIEARFTATVATLG